MVQAATAGRRRRQRPQVQYGTLEAGSEKTRVITGKSVAGPLWWLNAGTIGGQREAECHIARFPDGSRERRVVILQPRRVLPQVPVDQLLR